MSLNILTMPWTICHLNWAMQPHDFRTPLWMMLYKKQCKQPNVINFQEVPMPAKGGTTTIPTQEKQQNHGKTRYQHDFPKSSLHWMSTSGCRRTSTTSICLDSWSWILENYAPNQGKKRWTKGWLYITIHNLYIHRCYIIYIYENNVNSCKFNELIHMYLSSRFKSFKYKNKYPHRFKKIILGELYFLFRQPLS